MEENVRAHLLISGRVQGVCYRIETRDAAAAIGGLTGWVRNKRDGRVEAVVEGKKKHVDTLIDWCGKGPPAARVHDVEVTWELYRGEFSTFDVTY